MLADVSMVTPQPDFTLELTYVTGERRHFDMKPLLLMAPWTCLASWTLFRRARVSHGTVTWPCDVDIAPETLYDLSVPIEDKQCDHTPDVILV